MSIFQFDLTVKKYKLKSIYILLKSNDYELLLLLLLIFI